MVWRGHLFTLLKQQVKAGILIYALLMAAIFALLLQFYDKANNQFQGTERLHKEITAIARSHKKQLESNGLTLNKDGTISTNKEVLSKAADDNQLSKVFESLNSFKDSIKTKAENIALNPMDYVNNKIIAYKNPTRTYNDPYNLSAYTGMMFNGYI